MSNFTEVVTKATESFDPNVGVPTWVNVVVPISGGIIFLAVLWILHHTKAEIPVEVLEAFVKRIPFLNKHLTTDFVPEKDENTDDKKPVNKTSAGKSSSAVNGESEKRDECPGQESSFGQTPSGSGQVGNSGQQQSNSGQQNGHSDEQNETPGELEGHVNTVFTVEYNKSEPETATISKGEVISGNVEETPVIVHNSKM